MWCAVGRSNPGSPASILGGPSEDGQLNTPHPAPVTVRRWLLAGSAAAASAFLVGSAYVGGSRVIATPPRVDLTLSGVPASALEVPGLQLSPASEPAPCALRNLVAIPAVVLPAGGCPITRGEAIRVASSLASGPPCPIRGACVQGSPTEARTMLITVRDARLAAAHHPQYRQPQLVWTVAVSAQHVGSVGPFSAINYVALVDARDGSVGQTLTVPFG